MGPSPSTELASTGSAYPSSPTATPQLSSVISGGAIAGIAIGVLAAVGVGMGVMYVLLRKRQKGVQSKDVTYGIVPSTRSMQRASENSAVGELDGQQPLAELPTHRSFEK